MHGFYNGFQNLPDADMFSIVGDWGGGKIYEPTTLTCLVCTGDSEGHYILDSYDGQGITILIGDQHLPSVVTFATTSCVVVIRYSNTTLTDLYEYLMLPSLRNFGEFQSKE